MGWGSSPCQQLINRYRKLPHTHARGMVHRGSNRRREASQSNLAHSACAQFVDFFVGEIEEMHVDGWDIGIYRDDVVRQTGIDGRSVLRVVPSLFEKSHPDSHHDRAL